MKKRLVTIIISGLLIVTIIGTAVPVSAASENTSSEAVVTEDTDYSEIDWDDIVVTFVKSAQSGYKALLETEAIPRAGYATATGAKGIVLEILYKDKQNLKNIFKDLTTSLSPSSTDALADLVTYDTAGEIIEQIQCKSGGETYIKSVLRQVLKGKYDGTTLVGTKEASETFNTLAEESDIAVRMENSGFSEEFVSNLANKMKAGFLSSETLSEVMHAFLRYGIIRLK